jgi:hypothetical protein
MKRASTAEEGPRAVDPSDSDSEDGGKPKLDRRTWDKEHYAALAREKLKAVEAGLDDDTVAPEAKEIYKEAPAHLPRVPNSERAFLQTREKRIKLDVRLGQKSVSRLGGVRVPRVCWRPLAQRCSVGERAPPSGSCRHLRPLRCTCAAPLQPWCVLLPDMCLRATCCGWVHVCGCCRW